MYQSYDLSRYIDGDLSKSTSITVSDDDAINCAHMLAAGFNTISRNMMGDFVLAVVDTSNGQVHFNGRTYEGKRDVSNSNFPYSHISREVLEAAYAELEAVKNVLSDTGVETIPADAGVRDLLAVKRAMSEQIAKLTHEREQANAAARAEMIKYVKDAYAKLGRLDAAGERDDLQGRMRGMLDVLAKFLAVTGEADHDERHAVARRLCGIPEGVWV